MRERQVKAVGIDTASIDYGQSTKFETHVALLTQTCRCSRILRSYAVFQTGGSM